MDIVGLAAISFFYVVTFYVGFLAHKHLKKQNGSSQQFLLASRKLPLVVGLGTMTATWVGGGYINGTAEAVYSQGLIWTQAPWGYALSLVVGGLCFASIMRRRGYVSLLDPFAERYGKRVTALFYLPALSGDLFWSASVLAALGYTVSGVLNIDFTLAVIVSAAVAVLYTLLGGLLAVAYTDLVQLIFILCGLCVVIPFAIKSGGGAGSLLTQYLSISHTPKGSVFPIWTWWDNAFLLVLGGIPWGVYFQRILACPDVRTARTLSTWSGVMCLLFAIPPILIGMVGAVTDWGAMGLEAPVGPMVLPYIFKYLTPYWVGMLGASVVAAGVMSSVDSSILSASYMFIWNVVVPMNRKLTKHITLLTQITVLIVGALATGLALKVHSVYALWYLCSDFVYVLLFPQLVMVLFAPFATARGAVFGFFVALIVRCLFGEETLGIEPFFGLSSQNFPFRTCAMLSSLFSIALVSLLSPTGERARALFSR